MDLTLKQPMLNNTTFAEILHWSTKNQLIEKNQWADSKDWQPVLEQVLKEKNTSIKKLFSRKFRIVNFIEFTESAFDTAKLLIGESATFEEHKNIVLSILLHYNDQYDLFEKLDKISTGKMKN